jgi:hypothetical protein
METLRLSICTEVRHPESLFYWVLCSCLYCTRPHKVHKSTANSPHIDADFYTRHRPAFVHLRPHFWSARNFEDNRGLVNNGSDNKIGREINMATAKKAAPKAATTPKKVTAPAKKVAAKAPAKKAPVSKTAKAIEKLTANIAKLTERKNKLGAEINALRDQRTALKAAPAAAPVAAKAPAKALAKAPAKAAPKAAAPAKKAIPAAKK